MGIQDRDYYREGSGGFFESWGRQGAAVWLIVITCVIFFVQCLGGAPWASPLVEVGAYSYQAVAAGEVWRLFTSMFLHGGLWHLFFNMLALYFVANRLEELYGSREFLTIYLVGGVFAQCVKFGAQAAGAGNQAGIAVGASGAVTALLVIFAFHFPWERVYIWFVLPVPMWLLVVLFVALDTMGAAGLGARNIGYITHLGGALFGAIYYQSGLRLTELFTRSSRPARRARPSLRVVPPPEPDDTPEPVGAAVEREPRPKPKEAAEDFESRVDAVLAKVSKYGQESLTPEEREILFRASELYKKKRK